MAKIKLEWQDYAFIGLLAILLIANSFQLAKLKQLPSPIYGGDYYNHLGSMEHLYQGGSVFESGQLRGEIQWVPWLYHVCVVAFAKISGLGVMMANIWFSLVALTLGSVIVYFFISQFSQSKNLGLIAVLWGSSHFPLFKYSPFSFYVVLPAFYYALYLFLKKQDWRRGTVLGVAYGLAGLSNTHAFMVTTFVMMFLGIYMIIIKNINLETKKFSLKHAKEKLPYVALAIVIGFAIAMLWWYKPIFVYHAHTPNDMQVYGIVKSEGFGGLVWLTWDNFYRTFFRFDFPAIKQGNLEGIWVGLITLTSVIGIAFLFFVKKIREEHELIILSLCAVFLSLISHFITQPLIGSNLATGILVGTAMMVPSLLLFVFVLEILMQLSSRFKYGVELVLVLIALIALAQSAAHVQNASNEYWFKHAGVQPIDPSFVETREWVLQNTNLDDVFISTNEDSFALNAITGRKTLTYRRTHASSYADMNQRMVDSAVILYGSNDAVRQALIEKYDIKYVYWSSRWIFNEFNIDGGQVKGFFDPLMVDYSIERENELRASNVTYQRTNYYLDPAYLETYPIRDVLVAFPARWDVVTPWSDSFDKYLTLVKEVNVSGQTAVMIYKVRR